MLAAEAALDSSLEEQRALGLSDREAKLIPNDQAKAMVNSFLDVQGPNAARAFYETKALSGKHWDKLFGELVDQGLPAKFQLLGLLDPVRDAAEVNSVSRILGTTEADLKANLGDTGEEVSGLLHDVEEDLADFRTFYEFGPFGGVRGQSAGIMEAIKNVALDHYRQTRDPSESLRLAVGLIENHIDVVDSTNVKALVPRELGLSESDIEAATEYMQSREAIDAFNPQSIGAAELPTEGRVGKGQEKFRSERTRSTAANYGIWTTNSEGTGLMLLVPLGNGMAYTRLFNANGEPYEIKFSDIPDFAKLRREALAPLTEFPQVRSDLPVVQ